MGLKQQGRKTFSLMKTELAGSDLWRDGALWAGFHAMIFRKKNEMANTEHKNQIDISFLFQSNPTKLWNANAQREALVALLIKLELIPYSLTCFPLANHATTNVHWWIISKYKLARESKQEGRARNAFLSSLLPRAQSLASLNSLPFQTLATQARDNQGIL